MWVIKTAKMSINYKNIILCMLVVCIYACSVFAKDQEYKLLKCDKAVTIERSSGTVDIMPGTAGIVLDAADIIIAKNGTTKIEMQTPDGYGVFTIPGNRRFKTGKIAKSSFFKLSGHDSYYDLATEIPEWFMRNGEDKATYYKRMETGGVKVGTGPKKSSYDPANPSGLGPEEKMRIKEINDSLVKNGVTDSVVFYIKDAIFLERSKQLYMAKESYASALNYAIRNNKDTGVISVINQQFIYRTIPPKSVSFDDMIKN